MAQQRSGGGGQGGNRGSGGNQGGGSQGSGNNNPPNILLPPGKMLAWNGTKWVMIDDPSAQQQNAPAAPAPPDPNRQLQVSIANLVLGPKLRTELETAVKAEATAQKKDLPQPEIERIAGQVEATFRQQAGQVAGQFIENGMDGNGAADNTVTLILRTAGTSIKTLVASAQPPPKAATPAAETHAAQAKQEKGVFDELGGMLDIGSLFRGGKKKDAE